MTRLRRTKGKQEMAKTTENFIKKKTKKTKRKEEIKKLYLCCAWRPLILNKRTRN